jgi:predicted ATP-grasp superfamily ATP-dependent carboligase
VIQRFMTGQLVAYVALLDGAGHLVAHAQQRAVHTWPEPVGVSARAVTMPVDVELAAAAADLLRRVGITGLAELQFLVDAEGRPHLIDLNARFYGSLQLAISAGADLPRFWAHLAMGDRRTKITPVVTRPGVRYQWLEGDLRRSRARRDVPGLLGCVLHAIRAHHSIWSVRDPKPAAAHVLELTGRARRRIGAAR